MLHFRGTKFKLFNKGSYNKEEKSYMLVECHEDDFVFQIVCIDGYDSGVLFGFIKKDEIATKENAVAVTYEHLIKELKRNFEFDESTFELTEKEKK